MRRRKISNLEKVLWEIKKHPPWELQRLIPGIDVSLKRRSGYEDFYFHCPFHEERTPSCHYSSRSAMIHCFGCGHISDTIGFYMRLREVAFYPAVIRLAKFFKIKLVWENTKS